MELTFTVAELKQSIADYEQRNLGVGCTSGINVAARKESWPRPIEAPPAYPNGCPILPESND